MTMTAQPSRPPSDRVAAANRWRVWVILIAAPLLWLSLWLAGRALWPQLSRGTTGLETGQPLRLWVTIVADMGLLVWVVWGLRKDGRGLADLGLTTDWLGREALIGAVIGLGLWAGAQVPLWLLRLMEVGVSYRFLPTVGLPTRWLYVVTVAVCEENIWRGYALTELHRLYRLSASVVMAVMAFATFRLGEVVLVDWLVLPLMLYVGGWLSVLYLWRRSLIAPIVARAVMGGLGLI
jgi:membrane protease YdiL (CAAX protease family)